MKDRRKQAGLRDCLRRFRGPVALLFVQFALCFVVFRLYGLTLEPFWYALALCLFVLLAAFVIVAAREQKRAGQRAQKLHGILTEWNALPPPESLSERDYQEMIRRLGADRERLNAALQTERTEAQDFYTAWVHQIKTPVAVMKLSLGAEREPDRAALREELFRVERYLDMVLAYQRLGSGVNDLVIEEYALDELIRAVIRKFASQFIYKKLRLDYAGTELRIVTDKKWFLCILEQLVSNAVKYTPAGTVTISVREGVLAVEDTGVGIAPEDLPRIFERGYTGVNGRLNEHSSGLGLYLCGEAAKRLNVPIRVESRVGQGSRFILDLREKAVGR